MTNFTNISPTSLAGLIAENNQLSKGSDIPAPQPTVKGILGGLCILKKNTLFNLDLGIGCNLSDAEIQANNFRYNTVGLEINPSLSTQTTPTIIPLNCNYFETDNTQIRTGIDIKSGTQAFQFGFYNNTTPPTYNLGSNVWPTTTTNRSLTPTDGGGIEVDVNQDWASPSNWISIKNNTSNNLNYWRYKNEFIGSYSNVNLETPSQAIKCYTTTNLPFSQQPGVAYVQVCSNVSNATDRIYFPTTLARLEDELKPDLSASKSSAIVLSEGKDYIIPYSSNSNYFDAKVYTITGSRLNVTLERKSSQALLKTSDLATGVYLLLINIDSKLESHKIVIQ